MLNKVRENLESLGVKPNDLLIVAVSGGPDSVCLLYLLSEIGKTYPFKLHVGHLNHALRGIEADEDADFVKKCSDTLNIPSSIVKKDIASLAKSMRKSKQEAARTVRYQVLNEILQQERGDWIVTAHHRGDQAETFLMRLIRGSGSHGLSSIPRLRGVVIRPFLPFAKEEILTYLKQHQIPYREDSSNKFPHYFRNQIRQELLPFLEKYNPNMTRVLEHEADILMEEDRVLEEEVRKILPQIASFPEKRKSVLKIDPFLKAPVAIQRRILRHILFQMKGDLLDIRYIHIQQLCYLAQKMENGKSIGLPEGIKVYKSYGSLVFLDQNSIQSKSETALLIPIPGQAVSTDLKIQVRTSLIKEAPQHKPLKNNAFFDYSQISLPLILRTRHPGDFICPVGLQGKRKKLQDIFVDLKIPRILRDSIPLIATPDRVLWIVGMEQDFQSRFSSKTDTCLRIEVDSTELT
ncbi:MAG: tRNA lysidine(34) synthetase TilS [Nitrospiria bacterium]